MIDHAIRVGMGAVMLLGWLVLGAATAPSAEAASVDLGAILLSKIDGYQPAPPGVGLSGPLTEEQLAEAPSIPTTSTTSPAPGSPPSPAPSSRTRRGSR